MMTRWKLGTTLVANAFETSRWALNDRSERAGSLSEAHSDRDRIYPKSDFRVISGIGWRKMGFYKSSSWTRLFFIFCQRFWATFWWVFIILQHFWLAPLFKNWWKAAPFNLHFNPFFSMATRFFGYPIRHYQRLLGSIMNWCCWSHYFLIEKKKNILSSLEKFDPILYLQDLF